MGRYSIRTLLLLVAVFALGVWWFQSGFRLIHRVNSPGHGEAFIYAQQEWWSGQYKIRIQYDPHPDSLQPETHLSDTIWLGTDSLERLGFETSVDSETGAWCLYDMADQQIVFLVMSQLAGWKAGSGIQECILAGREVSLSSCFGSSRAGTLRFLAMFCRVKR